MINYAIISDELKVDKKLLAMQNRRRLVFAELANCANSPTYLNNFFMTD